MGRRKLIAGRKIILDVRNIIRTMYNTMDIDFSKIEYEFKVNFKKRTIKINVFKGG